MRKPNNVVLLDKQRKNNEGSKPSQYKPLAPGRKASSFTMSTETHKKLKLACIMNEVSQAQLIEKALKYYLRKLNIEGMVGKSDFPVDEDNDEITVKTKKIKKIKEEDDNDDEDEEDD